MRQEKRKTNASSGYTLMEVLIALAIFSIGLMAMGSLQSRSLMSTNRSTDLTEAWTVLEDWVGMLNTIPFYPNDNNMNDDGDGATERAGGRRKPSKKSGRGKRRGKGGKKSSGKGGPS